MFSGGVKQGQNEFFSIVSFSRGSLDSKSDSTHRSILTNISPEKGMVFLYTKIMPGKQFRPYLVNTTACLSYRWWIIQCILRFVTPRFVPKPDLFPLFWPWKCDKSGNWRIPDTKLEWIFRFSGWFSPLFLLIWYILQSLSLFLQFFVSF